jgi:hypothetical protein
MSHAYSNIQSLNTTHVDESQNIITSPDRTDQGSVKYMNSEPGQLPPKSMIVKNA